jgi:hypothetical protein
VYFLPSSWAPWGIPSALLYSPSPHLTVLTSPLLPSPTTDAYTVQIVVVGDSSAAQLEPFLRRGTTNRAGDDDDIPMGIDAGAATTDGVAVELRPFVPSGFITSPTALPDSVFGFLWDLDDLVGGGSCPRLDGTITIERHQSFIVAALADTRHPCTVKQLDSPLPQLPPPPLNSRNHNYLTQAYELLTTWHLVLAYHTVITTMTYLPTYLPPRIVEPRRTETCCSGTPCLPGGP